MTCNLIFMCYVCSRSNSRRQFKREKEDLWFPANNCSQLEWKGSMLSMWWCWLKLCQKTLAITKLYFFFSWFLFLFEKFPNMLQNQFVTTDNTMLIMCLSLFLYLIVFGCFSTETTLTSSCTDRLHLKWSKCLGSKYQCGNTLTAGI